MNRRQMLAGGAGAVLASAAAAETRFRDLPEAARCLYLRLASRVGPWFRLERLDYPYLRDMGIDLGRNR